MYRTAVHIASADTGMCARVPIAECRARLVDATRVAVRAGDGRTPREINEQKEWPEQSVGYAWC